MKRLLSTTILILGVLVSYAQWHYANGPYGGFVRCLAIDGLRIFAGTKNNGVFLSTDTGKSWSPADNGIYPGVCINTIVISGSKIFAGTNGGVYLSENSGKSWDYIGYKLLCNDVRSMAVIGNNIFAGGELGGGLHLSNDNGANWTAVDSLGTSSIGALAASGTDLFAGTGTGIFKSSNNGKSWAKVSSFLANEFGISGTNIYAVGEQTIMLSTDNGSNWKKLGGFFSTYPNSIAVSGSKIFVGYLDGISFSNDNGNNWKKVNSGLTDLRIHAVAISGNTVIAGSQFDGVFLSKDDGNVWNKSNNGLADKGVYSFAVKGNTLFAGTSSGLFSSYVNGNIWTEQITGAPTGALFSSIAIDGENIFAGSFMGLYLSTNNGASWITRTNGLKNNTLTSLAISGKYIFAGTDYGIYVSTDNGASWSQANKGFSNPRGIRCLLKNGTTIFAGTDGYGLYSSADNGTNWIRDTILPYSSQIMYLASIGTNIFSDIWNYGLHLSTDNGKTWNKVKGLDSGQVNSLICKDWNIFVGNSHGISFSRDLGTSWTKMNEGLTDTNIISLGISETTLYAGTKGGVWKRPINEMASVKTNRNNNYVKIYPNPSNVTLNIDYENLNNKTLNIQLFNSIGQIVLEETSAFQHSQFSVQHLPAGLYFVKVIRDNQIVAIQKIAKQ